MESLTLHDVLLQAKKQGASDVHYVVGSPPVMHLNNEFLPVDGAAITTAEFTQSLVEALTNEEERTTLSQEKDLVRSYTFPDNLRCRYRIFFQKGSPSLSFHVLSDTVPSLATLRLPKTLHRFVELSRGLVIVAGPYGSGRSSLVFACLNEINHTRSTRIITVESPIEYLLGSDRSLVEQREVGRDVSSYDEALKELNDVDAEVIFIDTLPNPSAIPLLLNLAMTRLIFIIVEAINATKAIEHILSLVSGDEYESLRNALADAVAGIIATRLLPRASGGRVGLVEVLIATPPVKAVVRDGKLGQLTNIIQTSRDDGMVSLDQALVEAVHQGEIAEDEALRQAVDVDYVKSLLRREGKR